MKIDITGRHIEITDALQLHIENKFARLKKYSENITNVHFILTVEKKRMKAEVIVNVNHGNLFAVDEQEDMYMAIDKLTDKLDSQLKKYKEKLTDHHPNERINLNYEQEQHDDKK